MVDHRATEVVLNAVVWGYGVSMESLPDTLSDTTEAALNTGTTTMGAGTLHLEGTDANIAIGDSTTFETKGIQLQYNEVNSVGKPQFYAGDGSESYIKYTTDGSVEIKGQIVITGGSGIASLTDAGALATQSSVAYSDTTGTKPPSDADKTQDALEASTTMGAGTLHLEGTNASIAIGDSTTFGTKGIQLEYNETGDGEDPEVFTGQPQFYAGNGLSDYVKYTTDGGLEIGGTVSTISTSATGTNVIIGEHTDSINLPNTDLVFSVSDGSDYAAWFSADGDFSIGNGGVVFNNNQLEIRNSSGARVATIGQDVDDGLFQVTGYAGAKYAYSAVIGSTIDAKLFSGVINGAKGAIGLDLYIGSGSNEGSTLKENIGVDVYLGATSPYDPNRIHNQIGGQFIVQNGLNQTALYAKALSSGAFDSSLAIKAIGRSEFDGYVQVDHPIVFEDFTDFPFLLNGWVNYGGSFEGARFRKGVDGRVELQGLVKSGTVGGIVIYIGAGYRPDNTLIFNVISNNSIGRVDVYSDGAIKIQAPSSNAWVSLSGISYYADN